MANSQISFYRTTSDRVDLLPVKDAQLIFVEDTRKVYLDNANERIEYGQIVTLVDDVQREGILFPIKEAFYFVQATNSFWRYSDKWILLTAPMEPEVLFVGDFPDIGIKERLYVKDDRLYQWKDSSYKEVGGSFWDSIKK